ncbi:hypothetical protein [Spirillospora albida]|uniref:hypothetical protein n=1 Tax=Spirillospora albida TaxID=58123 RepID=UPI00055FB8D1|nr:hypothetical protein [Spirillospora albida]
MPTGDKQAIGARLRAVREAPPRWSRSGLARLLREAADPRDRDGMPHVPSLADMIKQWEAGRYVPEPRYRVLYAKVTGRTEGELFGEESARVLGLDRATDDAVVFAAWLERSNVGDGTIGYLRTAAHRLAFDYARQPPLTVLGEALQLQARVTQLARSGRQRLAQTRELLQIGAELFALTTLLAGDVGRYRMADAHGYAAWTCADEAASDAARALVLAAQSKTARWESRYADAAQLARCGYELAPPCSRGRVLLAVSEATALQHQGDIREATRALDRAQAARDAHPATDLAADAWSCTRARQANYALQVGLGARDPMWAARSAREADDAWADGDQWVYGTWAQVRIGAALAHVMAGEPAAAAAELEDVFGIEADYRVVTISGRMTDVDRRLRHSRYRADPCASDLRTRIRAFQAGSLEHRALTASEAT